MLSRGNGFVVAAILLLELFPIYRAMGQQQGTAPAGVPGPMQGPNGVDQKDTLKVFHDAMAAQATSQQLSEFQDLLKSTEAAKTELESLLQPTATPTGSILPKLGPTLEEARSLNRKFLEGFSAKQKTLLKETTKELEKADASLEEEEKKLDQAAQLNRASTSEISPLAENLNNSLTEFSNQQLALGRQMGIPLASGQDLTFHLPPVKSTVPAGERSVEIAISGDLLQSAAQGTERTFRVDLNGDLSDLQQNVTEILRAQFQSSNGCGEHVTVRQATIVPDAPASVLALALHYERWSCIRPAGQSGFNEIAEGDGTVEMKLHPMLEPSGTLKVNAEYARIDAGGMMGNSIRSGALGDDVRARVAQALAPVLNAAADFRTLPPALRQSIKLQNAKFRDTGAAVLGLALQGEAQLSDSQANALARQLNQTLSALQTGSH
jgi:hypothetical protein